MDYNYSNQNYNAGYSQVPNMGYNQAPSIPEEYRPISVWGYIGYMLLFGIPTIGFIIELVFAFGGAKNINLRNFARSYLLMQVIAVVLVVVFYVILCLFWGAGLGFLGSLSSDYSDILRFDL